MGELVLSRLHVADVEVRRDCIREFEVAERDGDDALLAWGRKWGGALRAYLLDPPGREFDPWS